MNKIILAIALLITIFFSGLAEAQPMNTGRNKALGSAATGAMFGVRAPSWNPANLGFKGNPEFSLYVPGSFAFSSGNNSFTPQYIVNTLIEGDTLYEADKNEIIGKLDADRFGLFTAINIPIFAFSVRTFALNMDAHTYGKIELPADLMKMALTGPVPETYYDLSNVSEEVMGYGALSLSLAKALTPPEDFSELSLGMTFKYFYGAVYSVLEQHEGHILINYDVVDAEGIFVNRFSTRGDGVGLDLAAAGIYEPYDLYLGITLGNIIGTINWTGVETQEFSFSKLDGVNQDSLNSDDYWQHFFNNADTTYNSGDINSATPLYLMLSTARNFYNDKVRLFLSYYQGLNESPAHSYMPRLSFGSEFYHIKTVPLRLGIVLGGLQTFELTSGFGVNLPSANLDFGFSWQRGLFLGAEGFSINFSYYFGADYDFTAHRAAPDQPVKGQLGMPAMEMRTNRIYLTTADLGLIGFEKGGSNYLPEFNPLEDNPVSYPDIDQEPYLSFFSESTIYIGKATVADAIRIHLTKGAKQMMAKYRLMPTKPHFMPKSPLSSFTIERLSNLDAELQKRIDLADRLIDNAPVNFDSTENGKQNRKIMVKELKQTQKDLKKALKQYRAYKAFMDASE